MIRGERIYLTELDRANMETIRAWLNDPDVHRHLSVGHVPLTREDEERFYDNQGPAVGEYNFEIHLVDDGRYVGNVGLRGVDLVHRHGEIGIVIGDKASWGLGYGGDALRTCLEFAFLTLGLHSVSIRAEEDHARALELYRRLGFAETGRERQRVYREGRFFDQVVFDMLEPEYRARYRDISA